MQKTENQFRVDLDDLICLIGVILVALGFWFTLGPWGVVIVVGILTTAVGVLRARAPGR